MSVEHPFTQLLGFYVPWGASMIAAAASEPVVTRQFTVEFDGMSLPVLQLVLAAAGVLLARPLAPRQQLAMGWVKFVLVTVIMLIVALAWVAQSRPGVLFAFVVSIGLGFSGYSLIELAGTEIQNFIKRVFGAASATIAPAGDDDADTTGKTQ